MIRITHATILLVVLLSLGTMACSTSTKEQEPSASGPAPTLMVIHRGEQVYTSGSPAVLNVMIRSTTSVDFGVGAGNDREHWSISAKLRPEQLSGQEIQLTLSNNATSEGEAYLVLQTRAGAVTAEASGGELNLTIAAGRVKGVANAIPSELSSDFEGEVAIICWVPHSMLDAIDGGNTPGTGGGTEGGLVADSQFVTEPCKALRSLRP